MSFARKSFIAFDHVQVAIPPGGEEQARAFYVGVLGMTELTKPDSLATRGGCWFAGGEGATVQIHCGIEPDFRPAKKAHPAIMVVGLDDLADRIAESGCEVRWDDDLAGMRRFFCDDPFGNRIEFIGSLEDDF